MVHASVLFKLDGRWSKIISKSNINKTLIILSYIKYTILPKIGIEYSQKFVWHWEGT